MKTIRITIGALAAVGAMAMAALGAASASAEIAPLSKFVATPKLGNTLPVKVKGRGVGPQEFKFKKLEVVCQVAKVEGEITNPEAEALKLTVSYHQCTGGPLVWGNSGKGTLNVSFKEKALLSYNYAGWIESSEEIELVAKPLRCITDWEPGVYPEKATENALNLYPDAKYKTEEVANTNEKLFPTGKQKKILITNEIKEKGLEWEEEGEKACENFNFTEGEKGKYRGQLLVEVPKGNLEFKEPAA